VVSLCSKNLGTFKWAYERSVSAREPSPKSGSILQGMSSVIFGRCDNFLYMGVQFFDYCPCFCVCILVDRIVPVLSITSLLVIDR
jgi:hypothetical protein